MSEEETRFLSLAEGCPWRKQVDEDVYHCNTLTETEHYNYEKECMYLNCALSHWFEMFKQ